MVKKIAISVMLAALMTAGIANGQNNMKKGITQTAGREEFQMSTPYPIGEPNTGYAQYFIGNSYLAPIATEQGGPVNYRWHGSFPRLRHHRAAVPVP